MADDPAVPSPSRTRLRSPELGLCLLGAWSAIVPYLARPLGLEVDVATKVEIVDHVVPGVLVALLGGWLTFGDRAGSPVSRGALAAGVCALSGFWILATHVPLLADAADGREDWPAALWHSSSGPVIIVLAFVIALRSGPADGGA